MNPSDDPAVAQTAKNEGDGLFKCAKCLNDFVPANLDEASRGICTACLSPGTHWPESRTRRSTFAEERPRAFTAAEKSLIARVHGYMPAPQLLKVLNDRMCADLGADAPLYTAQQLHAEIQALKPSDSPVSGWANVRRRLAEARRDGVLQQVTEQTIDDFAVVFSLTAKQVLYLKDIFLSGGKK